MSVVRGRLPGASAFAWPSSRKNISLRVLSVQPSSGENADFRNTPPLGVSAIMLPSRSIAAMCVVPSGVGAAGSGADTLVRSSGKDSLCERDGPGPGRPDSGRRPAIPPRFPASGASCIALSRRISAARSRQYAGASSSVSGTEGESP